MMLRDAENIHKIFKTKVTLYKNGKPTTEII